VLEEEAGRSTEAGELCVRLGRLDAAVTHFKVQGQETQPWSCVCHAICALTRMPDVRPSLKPRWRHMFLQLGGA
jgi:hypothetical protein